MEIPLLLHPIPILSLPPRNKPFIKENVGESVGKNVGKNVVENVGNSVQ